MGSTVTGETIDYFITEQRVIAGSDTARADSRVEVIIPAAAAAKSEQTGDANGDPDSLTVTLTIDGSSNTFIEPWDAWIDQLSR